MMVILCLSGEEIRCWRGSITCLEVLRLARCSRPTDTSALEGEVEDDLDYQDVVDAVEAMRHRETDDGHISTVSHMWVLISQYRARVAKLESDQGGAGDGS